MTIFVGIDGEMSAADIDVGGQLIQIGVAIRLVSGKVSMFSSLIRPAGDSEVFWSDAAANVHNISLSDLQDAPTSEEVDGCLFDFLIAHGADPKRRYNFVPVGFNVLAFDMPFVRQFLPRSYSLFSRRGVDLNGLCFANSVVSSLSFDECKSRMMSEVSGFASQVSGAHVHDAGFDAVLALAGFEWFTSRLSFSSGSSDFYGLMDRLGLSLADEACLLDAAAFAGVSDVAGWVSQASLPDGRKVFDLLRAGTVSPVIDFLMSGNF